MNEIRENLKGRGVSRRVLLVLTMIMASIVLLEMVSAVYWYTILARHPVPALSSGPVDPRAASAGTGRRQRFFDLHVEPKALHPYLGFSADIGEEGVNSFGLPGIEPLQQWSDETLLVGLFGGSLAMFLMDQSEYLARRLSELERYAGREVVILNFALDGYKQPQQLQLLSYYLAVGGRVDLVMNLDGFNEVALPWAENYREGVHSFYPRSWNLFAQKGLEPEVAIAVGRVESLARERVSLRERLLRPPFDQSHFLSSLHAVLDRRLYNAWVASSAELSTVLSASDESSQRTGPFVRYDSSEDFFPDAIRVWKSSSLQMARLSHANGIPYFHFLQPNQYHPGSKPLSEREEEVAIARGRFPFADAVLAAYPGLIGAGAELVREGVRFVDLTALFAQEERTIYIDRCCHVNALGNEMIVDAIVAAVSDGPSH